MLQMVPLLGKDKSQTFVENDQFSCPSKLFDLMNDERIPVKERIESLQTAFGTQKNGQVRCQTKLSKHLFRLMTVTDPDLTLNDEI
jgi:hypothetical protein